MKYYEKMITEDFNYWLENLDDDDSETIYCLYRTIADEEDHGGFEIMRSHNAIFLMSANHDYTLLLPTEDEVNEFLDVLDTTFGGDFGSVILYHESASMN